MICACFIGKRDYPIFWLICVIVIVEKKLRDIVIRGTAGGASMSQSREKLVTDGRTDERTNERTDKG